MDLETIGWLVLRIVYGGMFLHAAFLLVKGWQWTIDHTAILFGNKAKLFAAGGIFLMAAGGLSIVFGLLGRLGGLALIVFLLPGVKIHFMEMKLAQQEAEKLKGQIPSNLQPSLEALSSSANLGHFSSALKNIYLAGVAAFFLLNGTGPFSVWDPFKWN